MNTGQSMLAIGAIILLSTVILRVNNGILATNDTLLESKFGVLATSLAASIIEEASGKRFDEKTIGNPVEVLEELSLADSLNPDYDDIGYDDFDDYNHYYRLIDSTPSAVFEVRANVCYVEDYDLEAVSAIPTWHKRITVSVVNKLSEGYAEAGKDTIRFSSIYSYWYFN
jgi:MSHA pilin protein MshD